MNQSEFVDRIIAYEGGEATDEETLELLKHIRDNNIQLQGHYGRMIAAAENAGLI